MNHLPEDLRKFFDSIKRRERKEYSQMRLRRFLVRLYNLWIRIQNDPVQMLLLSLLVVAVTVIVRQIIIIFFGG